jgi:hypothetical protein
VKSVREECPEKRLSAGEIRRKSLEIVTRARDVCVRHATDAQDIAFVWKKLCDQSKMDSDQAEEEFANIAFEVLDKSALTEILVKLDPQTILKLCQTNKQFRRICSDDSVFFKLMKAHYPGFPIRKEAKVQYMAIASGRVEKYYLPVTKIQNTEDSLGMTVECETFAKSGNIKVENVARGINFSIMGTKLEKASLWLAFQQTGKIIVSGKVYLTLEEAIDSFYPRSAGGFSNYVDQKNQEFESSKTPRDQMEEWFKQRDYPYPPTEPNVRRWFQEKRYLRIVCKTPRRLFGRCAYVVVPFNIE